MTLEELQLKYERDARSNPKYRGLEMAFIASQHELALALDLLRDLEWEGHIYDEPACPDCSAARYPIIGVAPEPHAKDCRLAAMIGAKVKP